MKILIVGNGGRERAIEKFLARSSRPDLQIDVVAQVDVQEISKLKSKYQLVIIGPEAPLVAGLADQIRAQGIPTFGPDKNAARLEGSKIYGRIWSSNLGLYPCGISC